MAAEYKLKFTAQEIEEKLEKISDNVGGTDLVAGDFIEIKDGVVRCTFGDLISGGLKEEVDEIFGLDSIPEMYSYGDPVVYEYYAELESLNKRPKLNEELTIEFIKPDGTKKTFEVLIEGYEDDSNEDFYEGFLNCEENEVGKDYVLTKIDENLEAIKIFMLIYTGDESYAEIAITTFEDFTGASLFVGYKTVTETKEYVLLPDTALGLGREIVTETTEEVFDTRIAAMENVETVYMTMFENTYGDVSIGSTFEVNITLPNEDAPINFTSEVIGFDAGDMVAPIVCCNCTFSISEETGAFIITKLDDTVPAVVVLFTSDDGTPVIAIVSVDDYTGASIVANNKIIKTERVKLPMEALAFTFDEVPTEGSTNLVNSGDLYKILGDIKSVIAEISKLVGGGD